MVLITCIISRKHVPCLVQNIQYVPGLKYALTSCKILNQKGLSVLLEHGVATIRLRNGMTIAESSKIGKLYFLNIDKGHVPNTTVKIGSSSR